MTDAELAEIEIAAAEASPGPWEYDPAGRLVFRWEDGAQEKIAQLGEDERAGEDMRFIANARAWVPELVAEVWRLRGMLRNEEVRGNCPHRDTCQDSESSTGQRCRSCGRETNIRYGP